MARRGCLVGLLGSSAAFGLIFGGADAGARHYATARVEERIQAVAPDAQGVHARIRSWPFLKVVVTGHVDELGAHMDRVVERGLAFTDVDVDLVGIKVQTGPLLNGKVVVDSIRQGTVTATILSPDLSKVLGVPVSIGGNGFVVSGVAVKVTVNSSSRTVAVTAAGVGTQTFPLPGTDLLPCAPSVAYAHQAVTLSCTFTHVPAAFTNVA